MAEQVRFELTDGFRPSVVPVMTTSILLHDQCGRAYVAALDYDTILFV